MKTSQEEPTSSDTPEAALAADLHAQLNVLRRMTTDVDHQPVIEGHVRTLIDVRTGRTDTYRKAWYSSVAAVLGLGLFFGLRIGPW
jgi:hypothetical protein